MERTHQSPSHDDVLGTTGSFIDRLPSATRSRLLDVSKTVRVPAGGAVFGTSEPHLGLVLEGTARSYLSAAAGRQLTVRYVRRGTMIGTWAPIDHGELVIANEAVTNCTILEFDAETVAGLIRSDAETASIFVEYLSQRLQATYETLAANAFGTTRHRLARHLLELTEEDPDDHRLFAAITQQQLADGIGTAREVVARALGQLRADGLIRTRPREIEVLNAGGLASIVGHWPTAVRHNRGDRLDGAERFLDASPNAIIAVNAHGRISYSNPSTVETFGWSRDELHGQPLLLLIPERVGSNHDGHLSLYFDRPYVRPMGIGLELQGRRKDGSEFPVEISLAPVDSPDGQLVFATIVDISLRPSLGKAQAVGGAESFFEAAVEAQ